MSTTAQRKKDSEDDLGRLPEDKHDACDHLRKELEDLRRNRLKLRDFRRKEIEHMEIRYRSSKEKLKRNLLERTNFTIYRNILRHYDEDGYDKQEDGHDDDTASGSIHKRSNHSACFAVPTSNYILQQEIPLLSAMHRSFCILPHQMELFESIYEHKIYPYFRTEIQALHLDFLKASDDWMHRLSDQAKKNDALYDSYRSEVETIEAEIKNYKRILLQQRVRKNPDKECENCCDDDSTLSATEHSADPDDESSTREEVVIRVLEDSLIATVSGTFHDHFCRGGAAFQAAANNLLKPFSSQVVYSDT